MVMCVWGVRMDDGSGHPLAQKGVARKEEGTC